MGLQQLRERHRNKVREEQRMVNLMLVGSSSQPILRDKRMLTVLVTDSGFNFWAKMPTEVDGKDLWIQMDDREHIYFTARVDKGWRPR